MEIEDFRAMLEKRGYIREVVSATEQKLAIGRILRQINRQPEATCPYVASLIDEHLGDGQHHMQHMCGYPLLRETKNSGTHETLAYRAVCAGPRGESLLECPQCQQYVQDEWVQEIDDDSPPRLTEDQRRRRATFGALVGEIWRVEAHFAHIDGPVIYETNGDEMDGSTPEPKRDAYGQVAAWLMSENIQSLQVFCDGALMQRITAEGECP